MDPKNQVEVFGEVVDATGDHRLILQFIEVPYPPPSAGRAFDFHSLVWEFKVQAAWEEVVAITASDFQSGNPRRRYISELHRLEPATGRAIIMVGEEGLPNSAGAVEMTYSWREWDLRTNTEVRLLQICTSPFELLKTPDNP
jgi:hypothetical protein